MSATVPGPQGPPPQIALPLEETRPLPDCEDPGPAAAAQPLASARASPPSEIPPAILELLGDYGSALAAVFRRISIAEDAINRVARQYPQAADRIRKAFAILCWQLPQKPTEEVFTAHVGELLERVALDQDVTLATRAEILMFMSEASLRAALDSQAAALFELLFRETFRERADVLGKTWLQEPWPGASAELLSTLRCKLTIASRTFPD